MNIEAGLNSMPDLSNDMDLNMDTDPNVELSSLHPTPINPERIIPVDKVTLNATSWHLDEKSYEYLKSLSMPEWSFLKPGNFPLLDRAISVASADSCASSSSNAFRQSQVDLWNLRYTELVQFHKEHGHCLVPLRFPKNPSLSHWVKRQRYQYRVKNEGKHTTLTDERQLALDTLDFAWDSHAASWEERWNELRDFQDMYGHSNVRKTYKANRQLAIWVKSRKCNPTFTGFNHNWNQLSPLSFISQNEGIIDCIVKVKHPQCPMRG
jgi:hypothetical protein